MSLTPARLAGPVQLGTAVSTLYTVPSGVHAIIRNASFINISGASATAAVYLVPSGSSPLGSNIVVQQPIAASASYESTALEHQVLAPGDSLRALASAATAINATISGFTF